MRVVLILGLLGYAFPGFAQERPARPIEIDPNTRIEGGADVRGSGASAGASARSEDRNKPERAPAQQREKDKPISERKPQEREDASLTQDYLRR